tara:strand:+ start:122 stop:565 length:444 start_codon:yes stop_codon:yes gene_type:complete
MSSENKTISQLEMNLEKREDEFRANCERKFNRELREEKNKFNNKVKEIKRSYEYGVIAFVFILSLISVILYRNMNISKIDYYIKTNYPQFYVKINELNYDINSYNTFEFTLIVATYHYIMYKIIINRFSIIFIVTICSIYGSIKLIN